MSVLFTALVVDSARLWMQHRQLQLVADIAAIESAKRIGCFPEVGDVTAAAQAAAARNGFIGNLGASPNVVELGTVTTVGGVRQFSAGGAPQAVHVVATRQVPASLIAGGFFGTQITLSAQAVAMSNPPIAKFTAGSFLLRLDTTTSPLLNALLGGLLGSSINLDLVSYKGLAATNITLLDLIKVRGDVGTVDGLLGLDLQVGDLLGLVVTAVDQKGLADVGVTLALHDLLNLALTSPLHLKLGDLLDISVPDKQAAANVNVDVLSLITAALFVANGNHAVGLDVGLLGIGLSLRVIEPPKLAIGPAAGPNGVACTVAKTAQIRLSLDTAGLAPLIDLALNVEAAQGAAELMTISDDGGASRVGIDAHPGVASVSLTNSAGSGPASLLAGLVTIGLNLPVAPANGQLLTYDVDRPTMAHLPQTQTVSSSLGASLFNALSQPNVVELTVLGLDLGGLISALANVLLAPILALVGFLLDPLLQLLGIELGGLDVQLQGIQLTVPNPLVI